MYVFVLNRGSSSIKAYVYEIKNEEPVDPLWEAHLNWKNDNEGAALHIRNCKGIEVNEPGIDLSRLIHYVYQGKTAVLSSLEEIAVAGHRIVHGGRTFQESVRISPQVKEAIRHLSDLAPLHMLPELEGIEILEKELGPVPQIAVFDTAFHTTLPKEAAIFGGPYRWYEAGIQRFGFHGISYQYCVHRCFKMLKRNDLKMVICHLGSGASLCAVKEGKSIDTTMGFTPLDGLMMDTRCGAIDPGILLHLMKKEDLSKVLYEESGLLGISGITSDMREIIDLSEQGNGRAKLAFDIYIHRLNALIGSMAASLQGMDVLVFTAGIGENAPLLRARVCAAFSFLGLKLDLEKNQAPIAEDREISASDSKIKVLLIHTQEAFQIAVECWNCLK
jgi:acetate kinase